MAQLELEFFHPDIQGVSDRTVRQFFKQVSKTIRAAQIEEIESFIDALDFLQGNERQSLKDQIKNQKDTGTLYYFEEFTKGSASFRLMMGAFFIWLLQATIGQTVTDAWKETAIHEKIIEYMKEDRPEEIHDQMTRRLLHQQGIDVFFVDSVNLQERIDKNGDTVYIIQIGLETPATETRKVDTTVYDSDLVLARAQRSIDKSS